MAGKNLESHQDKDPAQAFPLCLASEERMSEAKQAEKSREFQSAVADLPVRFALAFSWPVLLYVSRSVAGVSHFSRTPRFGDPLGEKRTIQSWILLQKTLCKAKHIRRRLCDPRKRGGKLFFRSGFFSESQVFFQYDF